MGWAIRPLHPGDNKWPPGARFSPQFGQVEVYCHRSTPGPGPSAPLDVSMTLGRFVTVFSVSLWLISFASAAAWAQGVQPYPNAFTDRQVHPKTAMAPPAGNTVFQEPSFGAPRVRGTEGNKNPKHVTSSFRNPK